MSLPDQKDIDRDIWSVFRGDMSLEDLSDVWIVNRPLTDKQENAAYIGERIEELLLVAVRR